MSCTMIVPVTYVKQQWYRGDQQIRYKDAQILIAFMRERGTREGLSTRLINNCESSHDR